MLSKLQIPLIIVADSRNEDDNSNCFNDDLDIYTSQELKEIVGAITHISNQVTILNDPNQLIQHDTNNPPGLVIPLWSGRSSRNRAALISAITEIKKSYYFGGDVYENILGQDKSLSKYYAQTYGLKTPAYCIIRDKNQLKIIEAIELPVVVKPMLQGSSMGISQDCLCYNYTSAIKKIVHLLKKFREPILVEKFIEGKEVTVTIWKDVNNIKLFHAVEIIDKNNIIDLSKNIWSYELKKGHNKIIKFQKSINLPLNDQIKLKNLVLGLGKIELIRIDGRMNEDGFYFLEMNMKPHLGKIGSVAASFNFHKIDYESMFYHLFLPFEISLQRKTPKD